MKFLYTAADIAFRAHIDAFLALEAVSGDLYGTIRRQFHGRRALSRAGAAAADAVFTFSVPREKRQDREQGKNSSHWSQETAEKTLLKKHTDQDQQEKDNTGNV